MADDKVFTHIVGVVGKTPEAATAGEYGSVIKFPVAVQTGFNDEAETRWYDVTVWKDTLQDVVKAQVYKGAKVAVTGYAKTRQYEGKTFYQISGSRIGLIEYLVPGVAVVAAPQVKTEEVDW